MNKMIVDKKAHHRGNTPLSHPTGHGVDISTARADGCIRSGGNSKNGHTDVVEGLKNVDLTSAMRHAANLVSIATGGDVAHFVRKPHLGSGWHQQKA